VSALSDEIDDRPTILAPLNMVETKIGQFTSPKTATKQDSYDGAVALALEGFHIRRLPEVPSFLHRQPISQANTEFLHASHASDAGGELRTEQTGVGSFVCQSADSSQSHVDGAGSEIPRFQVNSVTQDNGSIKREARFRTIPINEFVNGVLVAALGFR
jgi:hypothetical protein